jgi:hypothetical protein
MTKKDKIYRFIFCLILFGLGLMVGYDSGHRAPTKRPLDIYSKEVTDLTSHLFTAYCEYTDTLYENDNVTINGFETYAKQIGYNLLLQDVKEGSELKTFTLEDLTNKIQSVFGSNYTIKDPSLNICPNYKYNSKTKTYTLNKIDCGCATVSSNETAFKNIYRAIKDGNNIYIYQAVVYSKWSSETDSITGYYKDSARTTIAKDCSDNNLNTETCLKESTHYKFTFTKEGKNYIIKNITKLNKM